MAKLGWAVASCAVFFGTAAHAVDLVDIFPSAASDVQAYGIVGTRTDRAGVLDNDGTGGSYTSFVDVGSKAVSWESGAAVSGPSASFTAYSEVGLGFTNPTAGVSPHLHSTITPAGLGFYMANTGASACGTNPYQNCPGSNFFTLDDLAAAYSDISGSVELGRVSFDFDIMQGDSVLYSTHGVVTANVNSDGLFFDTSGLDTATGQLDIVTAYDTTQAFGFAWGAKDLDLTLSSDGGPQFISYRTSVTAISNSNCLSAFIEGETGGGFSHFACLVAYSGFGDPIGRGGGTDSLLTAFGGPVSLSGSGVTSVDFTASNFQIPTFENGILSFELLPSSGAVPEPATWVSLIAGFGLLGAALRRRKVLAYT